MPKKATTKATKPKKTAASPDPKAADPAPGEPKVITLRLSDVNCDPELNQREGGLDDDWVEELAEVYRNARDKLEPYKQRPTAFYDGNTYHVPDGHHRCAGAARGGGKRLNFDVRPGTWRDAWLYSLSANDGHGKPRTRLDKRKAMRKALLDPELSQLQTKVIARYCRVSEPTLLKFKQTELGIAPDPKRSEAGRKGGKAGRADDHSDADRDVEQPDEPTSTPAPTVAVTADTKPATPPAPEPADTYAAGVVDAAGRPVPDRLAPLFQLSEGDHGPHLVCLPCDGKGRQGKRQCPACKGRGWLSRTDVAAATPELREALGPDEPAVQDEPARALAARAKHDALASLIRKAIRLMDEVADGPSGYFLRRYGTYRDKELVPFLTAEAIPGTTRERYVSEDLKRAYRAVMATRPKARCFGRFSGDGHIDHAECQSQGWVPESPVLRGNSQGVQLELPLGDPWDDVPAEKAA